VDVAGTKVGVSSHAEIAAQLSRTLSSTTRSGGTHYYYQAPDGPPLRRIGFRPEGVSAPAGKTGLDLIANGYVLAPPSVVEGGRYAWDDDRTEIAALPDLLYRAALAVDPRPPITDDTAIVEGERNVQLYKLACRLRGAGLAEAELIDSLAAINRERVRPPLSDAEVVSIAKSAARHAEQDTAKTDELLLDTLRKATAPKDTGPLPDDTNAPDDESQFDTFLDRMLLSTGAAEPTPPVRVYPSGFTRLDELLGGGFSTRQLTVILGGPGAGKSALAISLARYLTTPRDGYQVPPVLMVSTELEFQEVAARFASPLLGKPWRDVVRGEALYSQVAPLVQGYPVHVLDTTNLDIRFEAGLTQIYELVKRVEKRYGVPPILIVDYLQELAANVEATEVRQKTTLVATALRMVSQKVPCAVIAIGSVSRAGYGNSLGAIREANEPVGYIALAKESGHIEYASATVIFVDVEEEETSIHRTGRLVVAKSRHGQTGFCGVRFDPALGTYQYLEGTGHLSKKSRELDTTRVRIIDLLQKNPGKFTRADIVKTIGGLAPGVLAGLIADDRVVQVGRFLALAQNSLEPMI